jgi:hypothetical protein
MKVGQIILPLYDNNGNGLSIVHQALRADIRSMFGGYTTWDAEGSWLNEGKVINDSVTVYLIAMERQRAPELRKLASIYAREACQACVMIVTPNGDVDFVNPAPFEAPPQIEWAIDNKADAGDFSEYVPEGT